jgi:mannose-6-phosphate isomerase
LIDTFGTSLLGRLGIHDALPLLYKFIDANDNLSVQVHPDDTRARSNGWGNFGKTECWYIVDARPGAQIIVGLREGVGKGDVEEGIRTNTLDGLLNRIPISPGDMLFMPAGTVHAILEGTLIYEVQESSDTTFRLYDWGRTDADGVSRPLHIPESLAVLDTHYHERHKIAPVTLEPAAGVRRSFRIACTYFVVEEYEMEAGSREVLPPKRSFQVLSVLREKIALSWPGGTSTVETGETVLIPAALTRVSVGAPEGARFLASSVPELRTEVIEPLRHHGVADSAIALLGGNPRKNDLLPLLAG